jgi:hypothetical protein
MKKLLFAMVAIAMLATSCQRHVSPYPCYIEKEWTTTMVKDTVIHINGARMDTIVAFDGRDTIFIRDHETRIETMIQWLPGDSIFVDTKCPSDTVRVENYHTETVRTIVVNEETKRWLWLIPSIIVLILAMFTIHKMFK